MSQKSTNVTDPVWGCFNRQRRRRAPSTRGTYYFCSSHCARTFTDPAKYTAPDLLTCNVA